MKEMNENEAIQLIEKMIFSAKREAKDNGFYFMLWGWLVFSAALIDYALLKGIYPDWQEKHALAWAIFMPIGGVISMIGGIKENKKIPRVKTYTDEIMSYVVKAFVISLIIICFIMPTTNNWPAFYPVLLVIYAIWLFIAGGALRFKPLIWGGYANWVFAIFAFFVSYDYQLLLLAGAVLSGYIIPGHLLKLEFNKHV